MRTATGYDGRTFTIGDCVELHPACDLWMRGVRFVEVVGLRSTSGDRVVVRHTLSGRKFHGTEETFRKVG
jgi:hypothetical protein